MGFFASINFAYFSIAIVLDSISSRWSRPIPSFPSASYELNQIAALKYFTQSCMLATAKRSIPPFPTI